MTTTKLTENEKTAISRIVHFGDTGDEEGQAWSWAVCGDYGKAAVLGSLVKKGLVLVCGQDKESTCELTSAGQDAYREIAAEEKLQQDIEQEQAERRLPNC